VRRCALVVLLAVAEVRGLIAARAVAGSVPGPPTGLVLRRGSVPPEEAAAFTGTPLVGVLPSRQARRDRVIDSRRPPHSLARTAAGVLDGVIS